MSRSLMVLAEGLTPCCPQDLQPPEKSASSPGCLELGAGGAEGEKKDRRAARTMSAPSQQGGQRLKSVLTAQGWVEGRLQLPGQGGWRCAPSLELWRVLVPAPLGSKAGGGQGLWLSLLHVRGPGSPRVLLCQGNREGS